MRNIVIAILLAFTLGIDAKVSLPDSMLTARKAVELTICSPDTSHAIIKALRERRLMEPWRINCLEADFFVNQRQFRRALPLFKKSLDDPELADSIDLQMKILMRLMYVCDHLLEEDELTEYTFRLQRMAQRYNNEYYKAHTDFMFGKKHHYQGLESGLHECQDAVRLLRKTEHKFMNNSLRSFYIDMLLMYQEEGLYEEAIRVSLLLEELSLTPTEIKMRYVDSRALRITYALRASLYAELGEIEKADFAYTQFLKTPGGNAIDDKYILGYLETKGYYEEALNYIHAYQHHLSTEGDSISHWMLSMLGHESILCGMLDKYDESLLLARKIKSLTETLHKRESRDMMTNVFNYMEEKDKNSRHALIQVSLGFMVVILALATGAFVFYAIYRYRNRKRDHLESKDESPEPDNSSQDVDEIDKNEVLTDENSQDEELDLNKISSDDLGRLYIYMDQVVTRDKLFLKHDLRREDLMRLLGLDKNRFGKMMTQYSDSANISVYINKKRAQYGAHLLKNCPDYTIATIAEMSGEKTTVGFNRIFRQVYGVTPSEYRDDPTKGDGVARRNTVKN